METLLPIAEQLDRAAVEFRLDHPIHNRLAVILIDNAVELMMRQALYVHTAFGGDFQGITAKHRKQARSQRLADRLAVLVFVKEFSQLEADFIQTAHEHRNAAYHEGTADEPYLRQLAFHYYTFACGYLARFSKAFYSWSSNFQFTEIGRRYHEASRDSEDFMGKINRGKLASILMDQLPVQSEITLQAALADDLEQDRQGISRGLRFLIENTRPRKDTTYLLAKAQFDWARDAALEKQGLENTIYDTPRRLEAIQYVKGNLAKFKPKYRAVPHGQWSQSIGRVRRCENPCEATVRFQRARKNMSFLRDALGHAVMRLEAELDRD